MLPSLSFSWSLSANNSTASTPCSRFVFASLCLLLLVGQALADTKEDEIEEEAHDLGLFNFVSRPDLKPPRWNITTYDEDALDEGYWFLGPYKNLNEPENAGRGWIGPHIYDGNGDLVWSAADITDNGNVEDFTISNVNGEQMLTFMWQAAAAGVLIDETLTERERVHFDGHVNTHEFNFVDDGTRVLAVKTDTMDATEEQLSHLDEDIDACIVHWDGFVELEVGTWEETFRWRSGDWVGLDESTDRCGAGLEKLCEGWDYIHMNSIDKTPEGDYLISMRHADTIHKISKDDGHPIWRLGGARSDFDMGNLTFTRQHNIRYRGSNDTHTFVSILDNALGQDPCEPSHEFSRGLLIALDEDKMTATAIANYDHPYGPDNHSPRRGNYQALPNSNVFMGWSEQGLQSEHAPNGTILQTANLRTEWLGTYRSYKLPFTGRPAYPPDVVSTALGNDTETGTSTVVHVSWNGATDVAYWRLHHATPDGKITEPLVSQSRAGFETAITYNGYAQYVVVSAHDADDSELGRSEITETNITAGISPVAVAEDRAWQLQAGGGGHGSRGPAAEHPMLVFGVCGFLVGCVVSAIVVLGWWAGRSKVSVGGVSAGVQGKGLPFWYRYQRASDVGHGEGGVELGKGTGEKGGGGGSESDDDDDEKDVGAEANVAAAEQTSALLADHRVEEGRQVDDRAGSYLDR
ncbi:hypothetical protein MBLNU230_g7744t1 [Neophaeotheca triangularis]